MGLLKIKIEPYMRPNDHKFSIQVMLFYSFGSLTLAFSMYIMLLSAFLVIHAQRYMLQGPPNALQTCVHILARNWSHVRLLALTAFASLIISAMSIMWIKVDKWMQKDLIDPSVGDWQSDFSPTIGAFVATGIVIAIVYNGIRRLSHMMVELSIPSHHLVGGDLTLLINPDDPGAADPAPPQVVASAGNASFSTSDSGTGLGVGSQAVDRGIDVDPCRASSPNPLPSSSSGSSQTRELEPLPPAPVPRRAFDLIAESNSKISVSMTARGLDEPKWQ
jgi:hypothetical protein